MSSRHRQLEDDVPRSADCSPMPLVGTALDCNLERTLDAFLQLAFPESLTISTFCASAKKIIVLQKFIGGVLGSE